MIRTQAGAYEIVEEYRSGWNQEAFRERYSDILDKYDFVVGDWGYGQLRLRGFYENANRRVPFEQRIDFLDEYLQEFCNFGCPYFVLRKTKGEALPEGADAQEDIDLTAGGAERIERSDRYARPVRQERQNDRKERPARQNPRQERENRNGGNQSAKAGNNNRPERGDRAAKQSRPEQKHGDKAKADRPSKERRGVNQLRPNREKVFSNPATNGQREQRQ